MRYAIVFVLLLIQPLFAEDAQEVSQRLAALLKRIAGDSFAEREAASSELLRLPPEALPLIKETLQLPGIDAEVRARLQRAVPEFESAARAAEHK